MILPMIKNIPPYTLTYSMTTSSGYRIPLKKCIGCQSVIDVIDDEYEVKQRKFLWFKLEPNYYCNICSRDNKINNVLK